MTVHVGDISFDFRDSCNCMCCRRTHIDENEEIYINKNGQIEIFDYDKAKQVIKAINRSMEHLREELYIKNKEFKEYEYQFENILEGVRMVHLCEAKPITPKAIQQIQDIFNRRVIERRYSHR